MSSCGSLPGTCRSQFSINLEDNFFLDFWDNSCPSKHPVFGKVNIVDIFVANAAPAYSHEKDVQFVHLQVISGLEVVKRIGETTTTSEHPDTPIKVHAVTVVTNSGPMDKNSEKEKPKTDQNCFGEMLIDEDPSNSFATKFASRR
jgi:cyclophilin family peptidyl-prolyl cis-trans isomerase